MFGGSTGESGGGGFVFGVGFSMAFGVVFGAVGVGYRCIGGGVDGTEVVGFSGPGVVDRFGTEVVGVGGEGLESGGPVVGAEVVVGSDGVV